MVFQEHHLCAALTTFLPRQNSFPAARKRDDSVSVFRALRQAGSGSLLAGLKVMITVRYHARTNPSHPSPLLRPAASLLCRISVTQRHDDQDSGLLGPRTRAAALLRHSRSSSHPAAAYRNEMRAAVDPRRRHHPSTQQAASERGMENGEQSPRSPQKDD